MIFTVCLSTHWASHIKMCYFQQVAISFHLTENEAFQSSCPCGKICISQVIHNQVSSNDPSAWSFFMRIHHQTWFACLKLFKTSESKDPSTWSLFMRFMPI